MRSVRFSYPEGTGTVRFDTVATSAEAITDELERATGFGAVVRDLPSGTFR